MVSNWIDYNFTFAVFEETVSAICPQVDLWVLSFWDSFFSPWFLTVGDF